ncbi:hypothetical protein B9Z55_002346 [Caenorhabditis nigoni]|uniref:RING-type domain-containing protein n=1 Tax=Caenorhabditis nigoni TaxID=1611254 RepID=A0A2G5VK33_9PELO|nr:hypothetical protein B9Z55_002346 [Caenorhabditis nigoni]
MDWVQCNNCGSKPNPVKVYLTACFHILCQSCVEKAKDAQCHVCKKPLQTDEICKTLRPDLMELFKDPRQLATDLVNELKQIATFQAKQREIYMKFKNIEIKKESEKFKVMRTKQLKMEQEVEKRKKAFGENNAMLKAAKEEKKRLTLRLTQLRSEMPTPQLQAVHSKTRTEPLVSKSARIAPPLANRRRSHEFPLNILDQSTSKIATSTPICNIDHNRRDYMTRMFGNGLEHPSPIPRQ